MGTKAQPRTIKVYRTFNLETGFVTGYHGKRLDDAKAERDHCNRQHDTCNYAVQYLTISDERNEHGEKRFWTLCQEDLVLRRQWLEAEIQKSIQKFQFETEFVVTDLALFGVDVVAGVNMSGISVDNFGIDLSATLRII
jgi:hypothetical protein